MKVLTIALGVFMIIGGLVCFFMPGATFLSLGWALGFVLLLTGVNQIVNYFTKPRLLSGFDLALGILTAALGGVVLFNVFAQLIADAVLVYLLGVLLVVSGIFRVSESLRDRAARGWIWSLVYGLLAVVVGVYSFFHPGTLAIAVGWLVGLYIIVAGVNMIRVGTRLSNNSGF